MQRALLLVLVGASYLLLAGAHDWTLGPLLGIAGLAVASAPRRTLTTTPAQRTLDAALVALCGGLVIQLLALPPALVDAVSPAAARIRSAIHFTPLDGAAAWVPLSVDARATRGALATVALGVLSFWIARSVFGRAGNTRHACRALALMGAAAAIMAVVQRAVTPRLVLFAWPPETRSAFPFGAFVNRNHMAAWLLLMILPVAGYLIARLRTHPGARQREWRAALKQILLSGATVTGIALAIMVVVLLLTLSRSAVVGLAVAMVVLWRLGRSRRAVAPLRTPTAALVGIAAALVAVVLFFDLEGWATRMQETFETGPVEFNRVRIWQETWPVVRDFWVAGSGAGTYSDTMTQYQQSRMWVGAMRRWAHFNNAHSHYVQLASEGGLLLAIPALAAAALFLRVAIRAVRADKGEMVWVRAGAVAGLAGLAVQSLWEVALTLPAVAVLAGVLAGLALYERDSGASRDGGERAD